MDKNFSKAMLFFIFLLIMAVMVGRSFLGEEIGLGTEEHWYGDSGNGEKKVLHTGLSVVHGLVNHSRCKGNIDECGDEVGRLAPVSRSAEVKRALVSQVVIALARVPPRSTGSITVSVTLNPDTGFTVDSLLVIDTSPSIAGGVKTGCREHPRVPVDRPLHEDQDNHVNKEGGSEGNHRKELKEEIQPLSKVNRVQSLKTSSGEHLNNSKDDRELHLEGVEKKKLVGGDVPNGIETKWVDRTSVSVRSSHFGYVSLFGFAVRKRPAGSEKVQSEREAIVVDQTGVHGEKTHHGNHVTTGVETSGHFVQLCFIILFFIP